MVVDPLVLPCVDPVHGRAKEFQPRCGAGLVILDAGAQDWLETGLILTSN
jgi:hypothetical protein